MSKNRSIEFFIKKYPLKIFLNVSKHIDNMQENILSFEYLTIVLCVQKFEKTALYML